MKKYLLIGDGESPHLYKWAKELSKYFELYLVSSRQIADELADIIPKGNAHEFKLSPKEKGGNFQYIKLIRPIRKVIANIAPDYVNAHYITSHGVLAALAERPSRRKYKLILSAWGSDILVSPLKSPFYRIITRFALNRADLVTTDSHTVAGIVHKLSSTPTTTFPFGLEELPEVREEDKDPKLFFSNRTLNKNSNIDRVLDFFSGVYAANENARLIIANEGPLKEQLIQHSKSLGLESVVEFSGFLSREQQNDLYKRAMYYFSLLTSDALSVSLLEAMAYGCIPLVSDLPDNREWVENKINGIVLEQDRTADILDEVQKNAAQIFEMNRTKIFEGAIFPISIKDYVEKIENIE